MFVGKNDLHLRPPFIVINGQTLYMHHRAVAAGYISRKAKEPIVTKYSGRFGDGYTLDYPRWDTSRWIWREYWILVK